MSGVGGHPSLHVCTYKITTHDIHTGLSLYILITGAFMNCKDFEVAQK